MNKIEEAGKDGPPKAKGAKFVKVCLGGVVGLMLFALVPRFSI